MKKIKLKLIQGVRDTEIVEGGFTAPKGYKISDFYGDAIFTTVRPMVTAIVANSNSFTDSYLSRCVIRARKRQIERFIIAFDAVGHSEKYLGKTASKMRLFTKGSRIKEEETMILPLPAIDETRKADILAGREGFALSFSLGDDYPCAVGGFALGSAFHPDEPRCALLTTDVKIKKPLLESALKSAVRNSFFMVEGGNGLHDCFYAVSSCTAENAVLTEKDTEYEKFVKALRFVTDELAKRMAEANGKKSLKITVNNAPSKQAAKAIVRNAFARGSLARMDKNIISVAVLETVATLGLDLHRERVSAYLLSSFGKLFILDKGYPLPVSERMLIEHCNSEKTEIVIDLGSGNFASSGWTYLREKI